MPITGGSGGYRFGEYEITVISMRYMENHYNLKPYTATWSGTVTTRNPQGAIINSQAFNNSPTDTGWRSITSPNLVASGTYTVTVQYSMRGQNAVTGSVVVVRSNTLSRQFYHGGNQPVKVAVGGARQVGIGATIRLPVTLSGGTGTHKASVSTANPGRVAVELQGSGNSRTLVVRGKAAGAAKISVKSVAGTSRTTTITVTVKTIPLSVKVGGTRTVNIGSTIRLPVTLMGGNGAYKASVNTANPRRVAVQLQGGGFNRTLVIRGKATGAARVSVRSVSANQSRTATITVTARRAPVSVTIGGTRRVDLGTTVRLPVTLGGGNGTYKASVSTANPGRVAIEITGTGRSRTLVVKGRAAGTAKITVKAVSNNQTRTNTITFTVDKAGTIVVIQTLTTSSPQQGQVQYTATGYVTGRKPGTSHQVTALVAPTTGDVRLLRGLNSFTHLDQFISIGTAKIQASGRFTVTSQVVSDKDFPANRTKIGVQYLGDANHTWSWMTREHP